MINGIVNKYFNDCKYYCEPFAGGLNIAQHLDKEFDCYYFNDSNLDLVNLYRAIRDDEDFENKIEEFKENHSEYFYYDMRDKYNKTRDPVILFYLMHTSFRSSCRINKKTNNFNSPYGRRKYFIYENLNNLKKILDKSIITNIDWNVFVSDQLSYSSKSTLFVCDPPYKKSIDYYGKEFLDIEELIDKCKYMNSILFNFNIINNIDEFDETIVLENKHKFGKDKPRENIKDLKEVICIHKET